MRKGEKRTAAIRLYLAVGCGAAIGSLFRFLSGFVIVSLLGERPLLATAFVNIVGSFAIMFFATLTRPDGRLPVGPAGRQFVMAGVLRGFPPLPPRNPHTSSPPFPDPSPPHPP